MVRVRLTRKGTTKRPYYRIVVTPSRSPRDGRFIEQIGWYDPRANPAKSKVNLERYKHWLSKGALPSETVAQIVRRFEKSLGSEAKPVAPAAPRPAKKTEAAAAKP